MTASNTGNNTNNINNQTSIPVDKAPKKGKHIPAQQVFQVIKKECDKELVRLKDRQNGLAKGKKSHVHYGPTLKYKAITLCISTETRYKSHHDLSLMA